MKFKMACIMVATLMTSRIPSGAIPHNIKIILLSLSHSLSQSFHVFKNMINTEKNLR